MDTIVDANIIRRDLKLNDKGFDILVDYLSKTGSRLIFPSIVIEEVKSLYKRALQERNDEFAKANEKLKGTLVNVKLPDILTIDINKEADNYLTYLHKKLGTSEMNIVPYKNEYLPELVNRAIERKKPLDNKGQQFRDGILWLTLLDYAESTEEKIIAFISDNPTDFAEKGENKLSSQLSEEAKARGVEIKYFKTLSDFAKEHASTIEYITSEWLNKNIDFKIAEELFVTILSDKQEQSILDNLDLERYEETTGYISRTSYISSSLLEFFVYEKQDGTILINAEIQFETEYEIEIEKTIEKENSRFDYVYKTNPRTGEPEIDMVYIPDYSVEQEFDYKYDYPLFRGKFVLSVKDKKIDKYEIKDWDWG